MNTETASICIIGSGRWATAVAKIVGENATNLDGVSECVNMFVYEELHDGKHLTTLINTLHVNKKYAPEMKLPKNVVAVSDLQDAARHADIIIFVVPHSRIADFCKSLFGKIKPNALAITLTSGFVPSGEGGIQLPSHTITKYLKIPCAVLVVASLTTAFGAKGTSDATLGCRDFKNSKLLGDIFRCHDLRVTVTDDADCVEVCGLLRHVVAFGAGLLDGFDCSANTKSACIRFGFLEIIRFIDVFYPGSKLSTFFQSCGLGDLITACCGSHNRRLAEAFVKTKLPLAELEKELLADKLIGPMVASAVSVMLNQKGLQEKFPLFTTIYKICQNIAEPEEMLNCVGNMPDIIYHPTNTFPL